MVIGSSFFTPVSLPFLANLTSEIISIKFENSHINKIYLSAQQWPPRLSLEDIVISDNIFLPNLDILYKGELKIILHDYIQEVGKTDTKSSLSSVEAYLRRVPFPKLYNKLAKYLQDGLDISFDRFKLVIRGLGEESYELKPIALIVKVTKNKIAETRPEENSAKNSSVTASEIQITLQTYIISLTNQEGDLREENETYTSLQLKATPNGDLNLQASNIPLNLFSYKKANKLSGSINSNLAISISKDWALNQAEGEAIVKAGKLYIPSAWQNTVNLNSFIVKLSYNKVDQPLTIEAKAECDSLQFSALYRAQLPNVQDKAIVNSEVRGSDSIVLLLPNRLSVVEVLYYWPNNVSQKAKEWLANHLHEGTVHSTKATFYVQTAQDSLKQTENLKNIADPVKIHEAARDNELSIIELICLFSNLKLKDIDIITQIDNAELDYMGNDLPLILPKTVFHTSLNELSVVASQGNIAKVSLTNIKTLVDLTKNKKLDIAFEVKGDIASVAEVVLKHTKNSSSPITSETKDQSTKNQPFNMFLTDEVQAAITSTVALSIPFQENISVTNIGLVVHSKVIGKAKGLQAEALVDVSNMTAKFSAQLQKDDITVDLQGSKPLLTNRIVFHGLAKAPSYWQGEGELQGKWSEEIGKLTLQLDLTKNTVELPKLNITKPLDEPAFLNIEADTKNLNTGNLQITNYKVEMPELISSGQASLDQEGLLSLQSGSTKLKDCHLAIKYSRAKAQKIGHLEIKGEGLDLSKSDLSQLFNQPNEQKSDINDIVVRAQFGKITLQNNVMLISPTLNMTCLKGECSIITIDTLLDNGYATLFYDYPVISFVSNTAGTLAKGLGVNKYISGGMIEIKGKMDQDYHFSGTALMDKFRLTNSPIVATILRLSSISASFMNLARLFDTKGIDFAHAGCEVNYANGTIAFTKCLALGSTLLVRGGGTIEGDNAYYSGVITPLHFFNTVLLLIKKISPKLGEALMEGKGDRSNFEIIKKGDDIKIRTNPLGVLLPGFLGSFFESKPRKNSSEK